MKKTLAILLSLALVICMIPGTAFASETLTVTLDKAEAMYDGNVKTVGLTVKSGETVLGADAYTVEWSPAVIKNAGDYTVTVKENVAEGAVAKTGTATFKVTPADLSTATVTVADTVYNGAVQTPVVTVSLGGKTLVADTDYAVTWNPATVQAKGEYVATVTGSGNYSGAVQATDKCVISALDLSSAIITAKRDIVSTDINTETKKLKNEALGESGLFTVKVGDIPVTDAMATLTSVYDATANTIKVTLTAKDTNNVIGERSATFSVKKSLDGYVVELASNETFTYTGNALVPRYGVKVVKKDSNGKVIDTIPTSGYTVAYSKNVIGGTDATVTVVGTGVYSGTIVNDSIFHINQKPITSYGITVEASTALANQSPKVVIKDGSTLLVPGTDYTVSGLSGNVATITGIGNYGGTRTQTFTVVEKYINSVTAAAGITYYYSGATQEPYLTVKGSDDKTLTQNYDYKITYTDAEGKAATPRDAGTYTYSVIGMGRYANLVDKTGTFTITPFPKDWVDVTASAGYTTSTPYVTVRSLDGKINFVQDKDFKVLSVYPNTYSNKVTVYLSTMGNIESGSLTAEYALVAKSIGTCNAYFTNGRSSSNYTGSVISAPITVKDGYYTTLTQGTHYTVTYKNSLGQTVSSIRDAGTYTIEITGKGMYSGTTYLTYTVYGTDISYYTVTLKESSVQANGYSKVPVIASVKYGVTTLSSNNYTVTYKNSLGQTVTSMSAPDTYTVVVTGKNGYQGSTSATFRIVGLEQEVTITNGTSKKVYEGSDSFKLTAKATGDGTGFVWTSSDPTVATVSYNGTVTVVGVGRAKITATTTGTKKYDPADASFIVKVYPDKAKMTKKPWTDGKKGQLKVRWGYQDGVTKYQIRYSTTSSFKSYTTKTVSAHGDSTLATQSTTLKNLKSGKKYYVKVRAVYQTYNEEGTKITYYGAWSPWKSGKTK